MALLIFWVPDMILILDDFQSEFPKEDPKKGGSVDCWLLTKQGLWPLPMCQLAIWRAACSTTPRHHLSGGVHSQGEQLMLSLSAWPQLTSGAEVSCTLLISPLPHRISARAGNEPLRSLKFHNHGEGPF